MSPAVSDAQVAGTTTVSVRVTELQEVAKGWSVKRSILGQPVYNDKDEQVGSIDDIIAPIRRFHMPSSMLAAFSA